MTQGRRRVLVVEDEAPIRRNLVRFMRMEGHEVAEAGDGEAAWAVLQASPEVPDLILCDVMMPVLDGLGLLRRLRQDVRLASVPLLFLSASAEPERLQQGLREGACGYITKPFHLDTLRAALAGGPVADDPEATWRPS